MASAPELESSRTADSALPPELLEQRVPEQIFVTGWQLDDDGLTAAARLHVHGRYADSSTPHLPVSMVADATIQVGMIAAINLLESPIHWEFMARRLWVTLEPLDYNRRGPTDVEMTLSTSGGEVGVKLRGGHEAGGSGYLTTRNSIEGRPSGGSHASTFWLSRERYAELRRRLRKRLGPAGALPESLEPEALAGVRDPGNALVSTLEPAGKRCYDACVIVDEDDPTYFGRPLDHVNGLLLLDAATQASIAAACRELDASPEQVVVSATDVSFLAFAELDRLTRCRVQLDEEDGAEVELSQDGMSVSRARIRIARLD
jgi:A-factor biosynthesis hotdog domain